MQFVNTGNEIISKKLYSYVSITVDREFSLKCVATKDLGAILIV